MTTALTIVLVAYNDADALDVTGPASVFSEANRRLGKRAYDIQVLSPEGGLVETASGVTLYTRPLVEVRPSKVDTLLVSGGEMPGLRAMVASQPVRRWVRRCAAASRRFGSICTGSSILAAFDLVQGKRVATHWSVTVKLAARYPGVIVDPDALFVVDGKTWTSAGMTTGIDMALAMLEQDFGTEIANAVARQLVLYVRRPGHQSQFSALLKTQVRSGAPFAELIDWIHDHLNARLDVPRLAARVGLPERSFYRKFTQATGLTPAQFVQNVRLDAARVLLAKQASLKLVAGKVGLPVARFPAQFAKRFGITPKLFREVHCSPATRDRNRAERRYPRPMRIHDFGQSIRRN
jgi:transcriptional regulator GlxA family with amidase domain